MTVSRFSSQAGTRARSRVLVHSPQCGTNAPIGLYLHTPCRFRACCAIYQGWLVCARNDRISEDGSRLG